MSVSYITAAQRTPIGKFLGGLSKVPAPALAAVAIQSALSKAGLEPAAVDEVILGNVLTAGVGQAPARQAALQAGLPPAIAALTVNKVCGSGLKAVMLADQAIRAGDINVAVAGGMENMSLAPHLLPASRTGVKFGPGAMLDSMLHDGLWCATNQCAMGDLAGHTAQSSGISRADQDAFSYESHRRAVEAQQAGWFNAEMAPVTIASRRGDVLIEADEGPRADATVAALAALRSAFTRDESITAGNASQISDGAAAVLVTSQKPAADSAGARIVASAVHGVEPQDLFIAPIGAIERVLQKAGMTASDIDLFELNEAFAAQSLACMRPLDLDPARVNISGGAIALGHPIGASGARVLVTLLHNLQRLNKTTGLAALCLGGGNAVAMIVER